MDAQVEPRDGEADLSRKVAQLFDDVRSRLVETGTRNRLVHVNRANTRGNVLNIVNEASDEVFRILSAGRAMRFKALGKDRFDVDDDEVHLAVEQEEVSDDRRSDQLLETRLGPDGLQKKLLKLHREAATAEEESGVNLLFLALGFLSWYEDKASDVRREAPLLLIPVELVRNSKTSTFDIRMRDDEFPTNLPLQQRLKGDFGIELPDVEIGDGWAPSDYFSQVAKAVSGQARWALDADGIQLGFFSFSKLLMYRDLDPGAWPQGALGTHELVQGLLYQGFEGDLPHIADDAKLDEILPPEQLYHIVDADASQTVVIEEVRGGRNLVVQGPPGTGKSQTITNIIAAAVKDGKRVLFVAEKMAALSVVHDRMVKAGLRDVCLELHSRSANKKAVLAELAHTLKNGAAVPAVPGAPARLREARDRLNYVAAELHTPIDVSGETGFSVLAQQSRLIGLGAPPPKLWSAQLTKLSSSEIKRLRSAAQQYAELVAGGGTNPFLGCLNLTLQPVDLARLSLQLDQAAKSLEKLIHCHKTIAQSLGADSESTLDAATKLQSALAALEGLPSGAQALATKLNQVADLDRLVGDLEKAIVWQNAKSDGETRFMEHAFGTNVTQLRGPLAHGVDSFFARWGSSYRHSSRELSGLLHERLPKPPSERVALVDELLIIDAQKRSWSDDREFLAKWLGDEWRDEQTDFSRAWGVANWLRRVRASVVPMDIKRAVALALDSDALCRATSELKILAEEASSELAAPFKVLEFDTEQAGLSALEDCALEPLQERVSSMAAFTERYAEWARLAGLREELRGAQLGELVLRIDSGELSAAAAVNELDFARAEALWKVALERSVSLKLIGSEDRHALASLFGDLEREHFRDNVTAIRAQGTVKLTGNWFVGRWGEPKFPSDILNKAGAKQRHKWIFGA